MGMTDMGIRIQLKQGNEKDDLQVNEHLWSHTNNYQFARELLRAAIAKGIRPCSEIRSC